MERGTVEWNSGMVERWNTGMVDRAINDPVPYKWTNWACALAIDIEKHGWSGYQATGLSLDNYRHLYKCVKRSLCVSLCYA